MNCVTRCPTCPGDHRCIPADGPELSDILFIGDRPHPDDAKFTKPLMSKVGREFNDNYLWLAGLDREDIRVTNTVRCGADGNKKASEKEIRGCADYHLPEEIRQCSPSVIVLMGGTACSLVPEIDLDIEHGIPRPASLYGWDGVVVPMYHPALGMHDTAKMIPLLEDFARLGEYLKGRWSAPVDPYQNPDYRLIRSWDAFDHGFMPTTIQADNTHRLLAIDTERHGENEFSLQFSCKPGTGYMMLCSDRVTAKLTNQGHYWEQFKIWLYVMQTRGWEIVLHNAGQDLDWLDRMGIHVQRFRDTMQEAYHLGNLPQGLKALVYRLFGIRMRNYEDVVLPHSRQAVMEWLLTSLDHAENTLQRSEFKQLKTKVKEIRKPSPLERAFRRIAGHTLDSNTYNPWKKLDEFRDKCVGIDEDLSDWIGVESTFGAVPIAGIAHVPLEVAVRYGCQDADMTLRVELELERRRREAVAEGGEWDIAEGDEDQA